MDIASLSGAANIASSDFPGLFRTYIANSVQATLAGIPQDDAVLVEETRDRALHVLSFALKMEDVWPATRDLLLLLAPKLEQAGHRDDWLPYLEAGVTLSQVCGDLRAEAELRLQAGHLHYLCSRFDLAKQQLNISLTLFNSLGDTHGQARTHNELAWLDHLQHDYAEATHHVKQALASLNEEDPECAMSYRVQGMIAIDQRRWQEAGTFHRRALGLFEKQGDRRKIAWGLQNLGYALRGQGKYTEAIAYYQQAIEILEEIHDLANCAIVQMNLGIIYSLNGQSVKAIEMYGVAELIFDKIGDKLTFAKLLTSKGIDYLVLHDWQRAENAFTNSIALFQELGDISLYLNALDGLGLTYLGQEQFDKASTIFESVLAKLPQIVDTPRYEYLMKVLPEHLARAKQK